MIWWNKLVNWWTTPKYEVVDRGTELMAVIRIDSGKYAGVCYQYGAVRILDNPFTVKWNYEIMDNPRGLLLDDCPKFREIQGNILMSFIESNFSEDDMLVG